MLIRFAFYRVAQRMDRPRANHRLLSALLACSALLAVLHPMQVTTAATSAEHPAVLFVTNVHPEYAAQPLHEMGFTVDRCAKDELGARLKTGRYNVVVVGSFHGASIEQHLERFLAQGGGVLLTAPDRRHGGPLKNSQHWADMAQWLKARGARTRVEQLAETNPDNRQRDTVGQRYTWTNRITPPVADGVEGVWLHMGGISRGACRPTSFTFSDPWRVVVRAPKSVKATPANLNHPVYQDWIPEDTVTAPPIMAVRDYKAGRLAVVGIRNSWLFRAPRNCPPAKIMLTEGFADRKSDWLRVFANTFDWLGGPSQRRGMGGASTPEKVLQPPVNDAWRTKPFKRWTDKPEFPQQPQTTGLIGARTKLSTGSGTVADYVAQARKADLDYLVFLEKLTALSRDDWRTLVRQCEAESDDDFLAVPGITYQDAQGNHLFVFADNVQYPPEELLLPERRLDTTTRMRVRALRRYVHDFLRMKAIRGFWRHDDNYIHHAEYHYGSSVTVKSFIDGEPIDDAFDEFAYMNSIAHLPGTFAFEIMTRPELVPQRAENGWRTVALRPLDRLDGQWHRETKTFSGSGSHYITNGPTIETWQRYEENWTNGEWYRPDLNQVRIRLSVRSDAELEEVTIYDGERVFRRWEPDGKRFRREVVRANIQQRPLFLVVEDEQGGRAISQAYFTRNLLLNEFMLGDRCNYRGHLWVRDDKDRLQRVSVGFGNNGVTPNRGLLSGRTQRIQPAKKLTKEKPVLPKDGDTRMRSAVLQFGIGPPTELRLFSLPKPYLIGPDIGIGQTLVRYGYDPAERGAEKTPLGYKYDEGQKDGWIAWGTWHKLVPTRVFEGRVRTYAGNWEPYGLRIGWQESNVTLKQDVKKQRLDVMQTRQRVNHPWYIYQDGQLLAGPDSGPQTGRFTRGTYAVNRASGGTTMVVALDKALSFDLRNDGRRLSLFIPEPARPYEAGDRVRYRVGFGGAPAGTTVAEMRQYAEAFGIAAPGTMAIQPKLERGAVSDSYFTWNLKADQGAIEAEIPQTEMPGLVTTVISNLNENWSAVLADWNRLQQVHRHLPIRGETAYAQLDPDERDMDLFIGHPVVASDPDLVISANYYTAETWKIQVHNPTDEPIDADVRTNDGWRLFSFEREVTLAPGSSRHWTVTPAAGSNGARAYSDGPNPVNLQVTSQSGTYVGHRPLTELGFFGMDLPGDIRVRADGRLGQMRIAVNAQRQRVDLDYTLTERQKHRPDIADAVYLFGLKSKPRVSLNAKSLAGARIKQIRIDDMHAYVIPLRDRTPEGEQLKSQFRAAQDVFESRRTGEHDIGETLFRDWQVLGPFAVEKGDYPSRVHIDPARPSLDAKHEGADGRRLSWRGLLDEADARFGGEAVDLKQLPGRDQNVCAYAVTTLVSDKARRAAFWVGSDDSMTIWLNGDRVFNRSVSRPARPDQDVVRVNLEKGRNTIVLRIGQRGANWGFFFRVADRFGRRIEKGLTFSSP